MKKLVWFSLIFLFPLSIQAADITLTVNAANSKRIQEAVGKRLNLRDGDTSRIATPIEVKQYLINHLKELVRDRERSTIIENYESTFQSLDIQ